VVQMLATLEANPTRALTSDRIDDLLRFAVEAFDRGPVALATLVKIRGGAARALGSHMVVASDGRFCGYVSGGCVEAAVATEALLAMAEGRDRTVKFGEGSPFFDVVLPCGGGISVAIHLLRSTEALQQVLDRLSQRQTAALCYSPQSEALTLTEVRARSGWIDEDFVTVYRPTTRVVISGATAEVEAVTRLAETSGYAVTDWRDVTVARNASQLLDPFTAVALLHHDLDAEATILTAALHSDAFYIGALGSTRTHHRRVERLRGRSFSQLDIDRIKAPIGMFGPTRDAASLALSVLADIAAARLTSFG